MNKKSMIIFGLVSLVGIGGSGAAAYALLRPTTPAVSYINPAAHQLRGVVRATGVITAAQDVNLSFERGGRIAVVNHAVGDTVKAGDVLMQLDNGTEGSMVQQARALLNQKLAGATDADIAYAKAAVDAARADADKTKVDTDGAVSAAQAALDIAQNNLKMASAGDNSAIVDQAYQNAAASLQSTLPKLDDALTQADLIIGVDNSAANFSYQNLLSALDTSKLFTAKNLYADAKIQVQNAHQAIDALNALSAHADVDAALLQAQTAITKLNQTLSAVSDVLNATVTGVNLSQTDLSAKKSTIQGTRSGLTAQASVLVANTQAIENAKNSLTSYTIAYDKAKQDLTNAQSSAASLVKIKESVYQQAVANYTNKTQPVRNVDVAPLRASLSSAAVAYDKTFLRSPIDGKISTQDGKVGMIISPNMPIVSVVNEGTLQIETLIPETDIAKVTVGNSVDVTIDAYGADVVFPAKVVKIDPTMTQSNGTSGIKTTIQFNAADDRIKPGMNANLTIVTGAGNAAVAIPDRSIVQKNGQDIVFVRNAENKPEERKISIGIKGEDGWTEVTDGLTTNDAIVDFGKN